MHMQPRTKQEVLLEPLKKLLCRFDFTLHESSDNISFKAEERQGKLSDRKKFVNRKEKKIP